MSLQVENLEHNMAKLTFTVPADEFKKATTQAYKKSKGQFNVPGFRKGKVPQMYIEKMYGPEVFYEDAANIVIPTAYERELQDSDLQIVSRPEIDIVQIEKGKEFIFTAEVALKPVATLGEYKGLEAPLEVEEVTEEEVSAELMREQQNNAREVTIEDRPVQDRDIVNIDFAGSIDGEYFEGGTAQGHNLEIGSGSFIDNFEEQLIGANIGDDVNVFVTFPENYQSEDLAGKEAKFEVKINGIKFKELPAIDDEFAEEVSEFDTLDEYKESIRAALQIDKENAAKTDRENKLVDLVIENAEMDIPDPMVEETLGQMYDEMAQNVQYQIGITMDQYCQYMGKTPDEIKEEMKPQALKRIQSRLVLEAIVAAEGIEATDEDVDAEFEKMADQYQVDVEEVKKYMGSAQQIDQIREDVAVQKALDFIVAEAK